MGYMKSSSEISLDIGVDIDMSTLVSKSRRGYPHTLRSHTLDSDNLVYGILSYKKLPRKEKKKKKVKYIQPKDYDVYTYLRSENSWYWGSGKNTAGSYETRNAIMETEFGNNYHKAALITCKKMK